MNEAKQAVSVAETEDRQRLADHARGRLKQRPKPRKPRAESDLQAAEERVSVLEVACADAEAELILAIEGHREDLAGRLDNELERRRDQLRSEAGKLAGSEAEFRDLRCLRSWLREPTRSWTAGKFGLQTELAGPNREPITIHHALAMIEAALAEPRPKQEKVQRLKPTAAGAARVPPPR